MFTPMKPLYDLSYLRSACSPGSIYYAVPQDHPVSSVCILLPAFHHLSTLILWQTTFKRLYKERCERHRRNFKLTAAFVSQYPPEFRCLLNMESFTLLGVYETIVLFETHTYILSLKQKSILRGFGVYYGLVLFLNRLKYFKHFVNSIQVTAKLVTEKWNVQ